MYVATWLALAYTVAKQQPFGLVAHPDTELVGKKTTGLSSFFLPAVGDLLSLSPTAARSARTASAGAAEADAVATAAAAIVVVVVVSEFTVM